MTNIDDYSFTDKPTTIYCVLTKKCNMVCGYCHVLKVPDDLDIVSYIDKLKLMLSEKPIANIVFYGGEPLLRANELKTIVLALTGFYEADASRLNFSLNTNGTLITQELAKFFTEFSIYPIVSLDGMTEKENFFRTYANGKCSYQEIIKGMNLLKEADTRFGVSSVFHDHNYDSMKEFLSWLKDEYSVDTVGVNLIHYNPQYVNT